MNSTDQIGCEISIGIQGRHRSKPSSTNAGDTFPRTVIHHPVNRFFFSNCDSWLFQSQEAHHQPRVAWSVSWNERHGAPFSIMQYAINCRLCVRAGSNQPEPSQ
jgi:hypothetical protein